MRICKIEVVFFCVIVVSGDDVINDLLQIKNTNEMSHITIDSR